MPNGLLAVLELDDQAVADELDPRLLDEAVAAVELDGGLVAVDGLDLDVAGRDLDLELDGLGRVEGARLPCQAAVRTEDSGTPDGSS